MRALLRSTLAALAFAARLEAATLFETPVERTDGAWTAVRGSAIADGQVLLGNSRSLRVEPSTGSPDACVQSAPVDLTIGRTYEVSGWVRTKDVVVRDLGRSPIATGAALTMASMPYDVHSASLGGTSDWTRLSLRFVASRRTDRILLVVANGGAFSGQAWFSGVVLKEASPDESWPLRDAVRTFGPAYRYPTAGWTYLHIEGKPYERGYQHGFLMAKEIPEYLNRCAFTLNDSADAGAWNARRTAADALFLRGFDREILEEMRGIADGANAAGARWLGQKLDLVDIVLVNTTVELGTLSSAMPVTPTGIEGTEFGAPPYLRKQARPGARSADHCSAFAATGPATGDGKMVIGHVTWWPQSLAEQTNVMLDIKPEHGHRLLMQSYPGGIESGTDWYQNDAGIVLTETTLDQTPFNPAGTPVAFRARRAIQYSSNIDEVVRELGTRNNGLYTNEWIIGDGKTDEIAMYELGTSHTRLWRSSRNEWFGGTVGFYWGDNNAKDLALRLEYLPDPMGRPRYAPYVPEERDLAWMELYGRSKGRIDEQFAFRAYDGGPLICGATMDAKVVTSEMATHMLVWAQFGRPNESAWRVYPGDKVDKGLYPSGYALVGAEATPALRASIEANEAARLAGKDEAPAKPAVPLSYRDREDELWKGWVLPASDADTWFVSGSVAYFWQLQRPDVARAIEVERIRYRRFKISCKGELEQHQRETVRGVLFLDSLRVKMGDEAFLKLMRGYYSAHTTQTVTAQGFLEAAKAKFDLPDPPDGPAYLPSDILDRLGSCVIVYGTAKEAGANRFAAEKERDLFREWQQDEVPILKDYEATDAVLGHKDVIFVGRPETNSALAGWRARMGLNYDGASFTVEGKPYSSERNALVFAARNPVDPTHMVVVYAGNSPYELVRSLDSEVRYPYVVLEDGVPAGPSALPSSQQANTSPTAP